jgi:hypothetical protein
MLVGFADPIPDIYRTLCAQSFAMEFIIEAGVDYLGVCGEWILNAGSLLPALEENMAPGARSRKTVRRI